MMSAPNSKKPHFFYLFCKRLFDFSVAAVLLFLLSPLYLVLCVLIAVKLGRPVHFYQKRPGLSGKVFHIYKFRSMLLQPPSGSPLSDAERLTPFGKKLRSLSLDEIPQLLNVLKGDLSLVGPRPLLVSYLERYTPEQARRHEAKPGITGWAQVNGRNSISWDEKFKLDVWYVDHRSMRLDLKILFLTASKVLKRDGVSHAQEVTMPEFLGKKGSGTPT